MQPGQAIIGPRRDLNGVHEIEWHEQLAFQTLRRVCVRNGPSLQVLTDWSQHLFSSLLKRSTYHIFNIFIIIFFYRHSYSSSFFFFWIDIHIQFLLMSDDLWDTTWLPNVVVSLYFFPFFFLAINKSYLNTYLIGRTEITSLNNISMILYELISFTTKNNTSF